MPCWIMPAWMERYRTCIQTGGMTVEEGMNRWTPFDGHGYSIKQQVAIDVHVHAIKQQVAMLIALREQGALKSVKPVWEESEV